MHAHKLHVVTAISNPVRYQSRYRLYHDFAKRVADAGAHLTTIELQLGERPYAITDPGHPRHIQARTKHELWHKENLLNLAISRLPEDAQYIAWIDADVQFTRPDWASETVHQLQHYSFVQMFSHAQDVGPNHEPVGRIHTGFMEAYQRGTLCGPAHSYAGMGHPGYAWAARRSALDKVGGLIDYAVLGSADTHMALALIGKPPIEMRRLPIGEGYRRQLFAWRDRAEKHIRRNVGVMPGLLTHYWHGKKRDRGYVDRWQVLLRHGYDPDVDLKRDAQGVWQLTDRSMGLRDDIRRYMRSRNEDSIDA